MLPPELTTQEMKVFRERISEFLMSHVHAHTLEWEQTRQVPVHLLKVCAEENFLGVSLPKEHHGQGKSFWHEVALAKDLASAHITGWVLAIMVQSQIVAYLLSELGKAEVHRNVLKSALEGKFYLALAATEPKSGSDIASTQATLIEKNGTLLLRGQKKYITNGSIAKFAVVLARKDGTTDLWGLQLVVAPLEHESVRRSRLLTNGLKTGDTADIIFDNTPIEPWMLLGEPRKGFAYLLQGLMRERLLAAVALNQLMTDVLEETKKHLMRTERFKKPLWQHQALRHQWVDYHIAHQASTEFTYAVCRNYATGLPSDEQIAMLKVHVCQTAQTIIHGCAQLIGAGAFLQDHWIAHAVADAQAFTLAAGTSQIMKELISGWQGKVKV